MNIHVTEHTLNQLLKTVNSYRVGKIGIKLHAPIGFTFSCQASSEIPCGACPNCVDRLEALKMISEDE